MDYRQKFIEQMTPLAVEASRRTGVDPRIIIAQAAVESNYGKSAPGQNYFGIKAPSGSGQNLMTSEFLNGVMQRISQPFRTYGSMAESVEGYADFINRNPRYAPFRSAKDFEAQLAELQKSGYATAPNYAQVVGGVARGINVPEGQSGVLTSTEKPEAEGGLFGLPTTQTVAAPAPVATPMEQPQQTAPVQPPVYATDFGTVAQRFGSFLGLTEAPAPLEGAEAEAQRQKNLENKRILDAASTAQRAFGSLSLLGAPSQQSVPMLLQTQEEPRRIVQLPYFRGLI